MHHPIQLYNTLNRKKENFVPINEPFVGLYVCGPTVYGDPHLVMHDRIPPSTC